MWQSQSTFTNVADAKVKGGVGEYRKLGCFLPKTAPLLTIGSVKYYRPALFKWMIDAFLKASITQSFMWEACYRGEEAEQIDIYSIYSGISRVFQHILLC